jgi:hypothetical protein
MDHKRREIVPVDRTRRLPASPWPYGGADRTVRASDHDREAAIELLNQHTTAGRLTLAEFEERTGAVYAAQALSELDHQLRDLPVQRAAAEVEADEDQPVSIRQMWLPWVGAGLICTAIWGITSIGAQAFLYPWPLWVIGPWGAVLLSRTLAARATRR